MPQLPPRDRMPAPVQPVCGPQDTGDTCPWKGSKAAGQDAGWPPPCLCPRERPLPLLGAWWRWTRDSRMCAGTSLPRAQGAQPQGAGGLGNGVLVVPRGPASTCSSRHSPQGPQAEPGRVAGLGKAGATKGQQRPGSALPPRLLATLHQTSKPCGPGVCAGVLCHATPCLR